MREYIRKGTSTYWRALITLFLGSLAAFGSEYCLQPVIPVLAQEFDLSPATASLAMSCGLIGMSLAMLGIASVASHLERKKIMTMAIVIPPLLMLCMAVSANFHLILAMRLLQGILLAGFPALAVAYINEEFDPKIIGLAIGVYVGANPLGGLLGRLLLSTLTDFFSWRVGLGVSAALYLAVGLAFWHFLPNSTKKVDTGKIKLHVFRDFKRILMNRRLMIVYLIAFSVMGVYTCSYNFIAYVLLAPPYNLSQTAIGFIFVIYLIGSVSSAIMGGLSDKYGHGRIMCLSCVILLAGVGLTTMYNLALKILGLASITYGFFGVHCNACAWSGQLAQGDKAQSSSMYMFFYYMGASIIGSSGGWFLSGLGWDGVAGFMATIVVAAFAASFYMTAQEDAATSGFSLRTLLKH